jgi:hypothetical protein
MQDGISSRETRDRTDAPRHCAVASPVAAPRQSGRMRSRKELP